MIFLKYLRKIKESGTHQRKNIAIGMYLIFISNLKEEKSHKHHTIFKAQHKWPLSLLWFPKRKISNWIDRNVKSAKYDEQSNNLWSKLLIRFISYKHLHILKARNSTRHGAKTFLSSHLNYYAPPQYCFEHLM